MLDILSFVVDIGGEGGCRVRITSRKEGLRLPTVPVLLSPETNTFFLLEISGNQHRTVQRFVEESGVRDFTPLD